VLLAPDAAPMSPADEAPPVRNGADYNFLAVTHGYSLEFEEGSWGARGHYSLPIDMPLAVSGGIDYFPEDDASSMTVFGADLSCAWPMDILGSGDAFLGAGPRLYRSTSSNGSSSSSSTEFSFGAVLGATYPVGPVSVYGDFGVDRVYGNTALFTRFGIAYEFGGF
ncbi:MAG: hypothetical protein AAF170_18190, partial [Bacteroidota bacterium]